MIKNIDEYLAQLSDTQTEQYLRIRTIVLQVAPGAEETFSYGMPAFKYKSKPLAYFGAFKDHMSLFPTAGATESLKEKLRPYKTSKGTVQFTAEKPLPDDLIREILQVRIQQIDTE